MVRALREAGITRVVLVTGDRADIADMVGRVMGVDTVLAGCDPAGKLAAIERESAHDATIMVGDGVNDAPALAAAGAGVALAARGSGRQPSRRPRATPSTVRCAARPRPGEGAGIWPQAARAARLKPVGGLGQVRAAGHLGSRMRTPGGRVLPQRSVRRCWL